MMKSKDLQPRLLYPAMLSFKIKGDKNKLKEFVNTSWYCNNVKGLVLRKEDKEKGKKEENSLTIKWHCIHIYQ